MKTEFYKYHSLLNDLVVLDCLSKPYQLVQEEIEASGWKQHAITLCDRHGGVGADGVIVLARCPHSELPEMFIFNADGSKAENCINGLRCVAAHLVSFHGVGTTFSVKIGLRIAECSVERQHTSIGAWLVTSRVGQIHYGGEVSVRSEGRMFSGHIVSIGNPHCIVFDRPLTNWQVHGKNLESDQQFPNRTNVEFVWQEDDSRASCARCYHAVVYERGSGPTLSCSSGAAAITGLLVHRGEVAPLQEITICMPGGSQRGWVDSGGEVVLQGLAHLVFMGGFYHSV